MSMPIPLLLHPLNIFLLSVLLQLTKFVTSEAETKLTSTVSLRIEGPTTTIFEGPITSGPRNLTAIQSDAGFTHVCDGVEGGNPGTTPFNTALDALDQASKTAPGFTYTLGYDGDITDFYILSLAGYSAEAWGLLYNWQIPAYGDGYTIGGCRQQVHHGDDVLWAYVDVENPNTVFLKVTPRSIKVQKGAAVTFTITDGLTGKVQPSATIHGVQANSQGQVVVTYTATGFFPFKAKETGAIRSEIVKITVTD